MARYNQLMSEFPFLLGDSQQHPYRTRSAVAFPAFYIRTHAVKLAEPAPYRVLQNRLAVARAVAFAMDNTHAFRSVREACRQEFVQIAARLIQRGAMQIQAGLDRKSTRLNSS